jgi:molybdenum cofactor biosynthesis enzyme MoaA
MTKPMTPESTFVTDADIEHYRASRKETTFQGCTQLYQFFVKADGRMSCSCMGYWNILADMRSIDAGNYFNGPMMQYIRESFAAGYEPFSFCDGCASRLSTYEAKDLNYRFIDLHIEPSSQCNLFCEACLCTFERLSQNPPARMILDYGLFRKSLYEIKGAGLSLRTLALVGFGEPLFNSRTPDMARLGRELFPDASIYVDTNANFGKRRAQELADCGLNVIRLALDGIDEDSYQLYRRNGNFAQALQFTRDLAEEIRRTNSPTRALWKYILFDHNDRDDQLLQAVSMAREIGIAIEFDGTVGGNASKRAPAEIEAIVGHKIGRSIDPTSTTGEAMQLGEPNATSPIGRILARLRKRTASKVVIASSGGQANR